MEGLKNKIEGCPYITFCKDYDQGGKICNGEDYTNCNKYIKLVTDSKLAYEIK